MKLLNFYHMYIDIKLFITSRLCCFFTSYIMTEKTLKPYPWRLWQGKNFLSHKESEKNM